MSSARQPSTAPVSGSERRPGAEANAADLSDSQLVIAIARLDYGALAEVYSRHGGRVFEVARQVCGAEAAPDVVTSVFLSLWRQPEDFGPQPSPLEALLLTVAHRRAVSTVRASPGGRRPPHSAQRARQSRARLDVERWAASAGISDDPAWQRLSALPRAERDAIALAYLGGHTYAEVAATLCLKETTVRRRIRKGLGMLAGE